ncbi:pyridoxamine 5'-phosphate oxidase family protein [Planktotalea sp.]|uniref:pyridoxamine 5'-phosphate oxidase family protein n=1 Tax=Planktotalea sp. TaxID=2029877 RepID=UPI0025CB9127|nr:pyridoxamine 5'-phosphate oxidase family protein [Planktotalea sp.]
MIKKDNMSREPMNFPNDLRAFLDEAWRHLQEGVADSRSPARYPTFATVAADGAPEARTVALRSASRSQSMLELHTDIATSKVVALQRSPKAAFLVWLPYANLQIRVTTTVDIQTGSAVDEQWDRVPVASRVSYGTEPTPGTVISDAYAYEKPSKRERFAVLMCSMLSMDLVELGERHRRASFRRENDWVGEWLAP